MNFYAEICDENRVIGVKQVSGEIYDETMISIPAYDESLIGKIWNGAEFEDPPAPNALYIHLEMAGGDGRDPIGIKNNGTDALNVTATFRQTEDPESAIIEAITGLSWRVTVRNDEGQIYDIVDVPFVDGVAAFDYTTENKTDICKILETDFEQTEMGGVTYTLKLVGDSTFKVYRAL